MLHPIWKNYPIDLGDHESVEYVIGYVAEDSITTIYHGKAWRRPGKDRITISINDVCSDWLVNTFPSLIDGFDQQELPVEFVVQTISNAGIYTEVDRVRFINDWSYDATHDAETDGMHAPINSKIDNRQWLLWTGLNVAEVRIDVTMVNGESFFRIIPVAISADFNIDFNEDFAISVRTAGSGTLVISPSAWGDVASITINQNITYKVVNSCSRYVLYYRNAYGGWDSLLLEGASREEDSLARSFIQTEGDHSRTKSNLFNDITKSITLNTSWLSDAESRRMHHLLNSTDIYLHDLEKNEMLPVIMESSSTPYKTYKGEGCKLVNYSIDVTIAQSRMRR